MSFELLQKFIYRVQVGDTLQSICEMFNTSKENILRNNSEISFYEGEIIEIKQNEFITHLVKPAETLKSIATNYLVDIEDLKEQNNLTSEKLFIGQVIRIYKRKKTL